MRVILLLIYLSVPVNIDVLVTESGVCYDGIPYVRTTMDFKEYVKGVLPNEWYPSFEQESLRAGAVAVKQFAVREYLVHGYLWGCNWDQVYNPVMRTEATDKAVDDTWGVWLIDDEIVKTYHDDRYSTCLLRGATNCMGQWDSQTMALEGMGYRSILTSFYEGEIVTPPLSRIDWFLSSLLW